MSYRSKHDSHADVKARTRRNQVIALDPDIQARYDIEELDLDDNDAPSRPRERTMNKSAQNRANKQLQGAVSGTRTTFINLITVRDCASSGIPYILKTIQTYTDVFRPIAPQINGNDIEFYIADYSEAISVESWSRRIVDKKNKGNRLVIHKKKVPAPWSNLDRSTRDIINNVIKKRYNASTNSLDLSDFGSDSEFTSRKLMCGLSRNDVMVAVCDVIEQEYSNIDGLSLKDNRLRSLIYPSTLCFRAKKVRILDLSNNDFTLIENLEKISFWDVEKLHFENNPIWNTYLTTSTADAYLRDVHKYLPCINYLDGQIVEPKAIPKIEEEKRSSLLPSPRLGYSDNDAVKNMIETFLNEFINLYDDTDPVTTRKSLINAYYEDAEFSYAVGTVESLSYARGDPLTFQSYMRGSRNIVFEEKWRQRPESVKYKGAMNIAVQLSKLPGTQHLKETFVLDIDFFQDQLCGFTLRGLFRDQPLTDERNYKYFTRNFLVVSTGEGTMAIVLDTWNITPITKNLAEGYRQGLNMAAALSAELPGTSGLHQPSRQNITGPLVPTIMVTAPPPTPNN